MKGMNAGYVILVLKIAVAAVTILLAASLLALARGRYRLHGRINTVFFVLTIAALLGLEVIARLLDPELFNQYLEEHRAADALRIHLGFSIPSALLLFFMLITGWAHRRYWHIGLGVVFLVLWTGTFITGIFFLPHELP
jgi:uncharacterized membrane protein YozB (DUF420 family)